MSGAAKPYGEWLLAGEDETFVYALGRLGTNAWHAHVQSAGPERVGTQEKKRIARLIAAAPVLLGALIELDKRLRECAALPITMAEAYDSFYQQVVSTAIAAATQGASHG